MSTLSERTHGLSARLPDRPRDLQDVSLWLIDGTQIEGVLHLAPGTRTLDFLNRQSEGFVAMTDAVLRQGERVEHIAFVAINKQHIIRLVEADDPTRSS